MRKKIKINSERTIDKMKEKKERIIKCPVCGCEYLPAEIFLPNVFFGRPREIDREYMSGKILGYMGNSMNLTETYTCDRCEHTFKVNTSISFNTTELKNDTYKTKFKKERLFLAEN